MKFRLEIRDREFVTRHILDSEYMNLSWSYSRIGGCGSVGFELPRKRFEERAITGGDNIRLYYRNTETDVYDLWYQGLVEEKTPTLRGNSETISFQGHGYQSQLSDVYLNNLTFTSLETSAIASAIIGTYVDPVKDINYSAGLIATTSFTPSSITFNETALSAITKLSDLAGSVEWGVDKDRNFFFKQKSSEIGFRFVDGTHINEFQDILDFKEIANEVYVQGAQTGGTYHFFGPYSELSSQAKYGVITNVISNSSITTSDVGAQFATSYIADKSEVSKRASCSLIDFSGLMESTTPIKLFAEIGKRFKYGQKKWGTGLYSGIVSRLINRINYSLTNNGSLNIRLDLGQLKPNIAESIKGIEYELQQQKQAAL